MSALPDNIGGALQGPGWPAHQAGPQEIGLFSPPRCASRGSETCEVPLTTSACFFRLVPFKSLRPNGTRGFKAALNVSPHQWVLNRRISVRARRLKIVRRIVLKSAASNFIVFESSHNT
jgi:hypothetical protein